MSGHTIRLHRVLCAPADRVYNAFITPAALGKWLPPHGFICEVHALDARVGGRFRMSFINLGNGQAHSFGGEYLELVPGERLRYSDVFDDPGLPGTLITTIDLKPVSCGTAVSIVQEGVPEVIPEEGCYVGWQQSLQLLALLVEAEIPG
jgi:uncharacterized protein YndB with AHSA1/START domain